MRLHPKDEQELSGYSMALFIAAGFLTDWPHEWTRIGYLTLKKHGGHQIHERAELHASIRERRAEPKPRPSSRPMDG